MSDPTPIERLIVSLRDDLEKVTAERDKWFMAAASEEQRADQRTMERDELQRRIDAIENLHHPETDPFHPDRECCAECSDDEQTEPYPCDTVKLARGESL